MVSNSILNGVYQLRYAVLTGDRKRLLDDIHCLSPTPKSVNQRKSWKKRRAAGNR